MCTKISLKEEGKIFYVWNIIKSKLKHGSEGFHSFSKNPFPD
jgi:hypothetical protein